MAGSSLRLEGTGRGQVEGQVVAVKSCIARQERVAVYKDYDAAFKFLMEVDREGCYVLADRGWLGMSLCNRLEVSTFGDDVFSRSRAFVNFLSDRFELGS